MTYLADNQVIMQKAMSQFKRFTANDEMREIYEAREKAAHDKASFLYTSFLEGQAEGIEKGLAQGRAEGLSQGRYETARKMLEFGESVEKIAIFTDLSIEEIKKLK